jgi:hypothetical protein
MVSEGYVDSIGDIFAGIRYLPDPGSICLLLPVPNVDQSRCKPQRQTKLPTDNFLQREPDFQSCSKAKW